MIIRRNSALIVIFLFLVAQGLLTAYLYQSWQGKQGVHEQRQVQSVQTAYQAAIKSFQLATEVYVDEVVRQPEILQLFQTGLIATSEPEQAIARGQLYRALWPSYQALSTNSLRQIQFHQPDGRSYLRFFQPEAWGDDLLAFRPSVRQVLETREPVAAFEAGLSLTGFRYVYPLDWEGQGLGSVELSVPFRAVQTLMRELDPSQDYHLYLKRSMVEPVVNPNFFVLYRESCLHPDYLLEDPGLELPDSPLPPSVQVQGINQQLNATPPVIAAMETGQTHTLFAQIEGQTWSVILLPIKDLRGQTVAYVAAYGKDAFAAALRHDFFVNLLFGTALLVAILLLVYRLLASREALVAEKDYQHAITDSMAEGLYALDRQGRFSFVNPSALSLLGLLEHQVLGQPENTLLEWQTTSDTVPEPLDRLSGAVRVYQGEARLLRSDGEQLDVEVTSRPLYKNGATTGSVTLLRDISERKRTEERLLLAASVFSSAQEGIIITRPDASILMVNDAFTQITGYSFGEVEERNPSLLQSGRHDREFYIQMWRQLVSDGWWKGEIWNRTKEGRVYLQSSTITAVTNAQGQTLHYVGLVSDITQLKQHQQELEYLAHYDPLTHLPNRVLLHQRLVEIMQQVQAQGTRLLVGYLDLDDFKEVNDVSGHETGDLLLKSMGSRLQFVLGQDALIARLGGDEFAFILQQQDALETSLDQVKILLEETAKPFLVHGRRFKVSASVGLSIYPQSTEVDADQLMRQADQAMYQAKQAGKNRYQIFDTELDHQMRGQYETLSRLTEALENNEFRLFYQPKVNLMTGDVVGVEALIRWQHPDRGLLPPAFFLSVMDQHPLEVQVSHWVIRNALKQVAEWKKADIHLPVSVNICAQHLQQPDFVAQIEHHLAEQESLCGTDLELEILESSVLGDIHHAFKVINDCRRLQVSFALDDFGTGYSSLAYLKRLPADVIKIDQSFVRDMLDDSDDLAILQGVMGLARAFEREVIAEGVETYQHAALLTQLGCRLAQGYGIARPMPAEDLPAWLTSWQVSPWRFND